MPDDEVSRSGITLPYVGSRYDELGLLILGINQNDCGGLDALDRLVRDARAEIRDGAVVVFRNLPEYRGSQLWHRVGCFGAVFAEAAGLMSLADRPGEFPLAAEIDFAYEFLGFTNHVKCAPRDKRSEPTRAMWKTCGHFLLPSELRALKPRLILVLGVTDNTDSLGNCA